MMKTDELEKLIDNYHDNKFDSKKDLDSDLLSTNEYLKLVRGSISIFEKNHDNIVNLLNNDVDKFYSENVIESLSHILKKQIKEYDKISVFIVKQKLESINSEVMKLLREEIDNIIYLIDPVLSARSYVISKEQTLAAANIYYKYDKFKIIKNKLNLIENKTITTESLKFDWKRLLSTITKFLIVIFFISAIIINILFQDGFTKTLNSFLIIIGFLLTLTWIPFSFFRNLPLKNKPFLILFFAAIMSIGIPYTFEKGFLVALILVILLIFVPPAVILKQDAKFVERADKIRKILFFPTIITLFVAFLITREPLWLLGWAIWSTFTLISSISSTYFRPTIGLISKQDDSEENFIIDPWIFYAVFFVSVVISSGVLVNLTNTFLASIYQSSAQIALVLVGFLLTVQGVLSTTSLRANTDKEQIKELKMILKFTEALRGFMIIFISLFVLSIIGFFSTNFSLSLSFNINWLISSIGYDEWKILILSLLFTSFVTILALSVCYLYYLFLSRNLMLLPLKSRFVSNSVLIEKISSSLNNTEQIENALKNEPKLNGLVIIENLILEKHDYGLFANIQLDVSSPDKIELMNLARILSDVLIKKNKFSKISIMARSKHGSLGIMKIFQVDMDAKALEFLDKDNGLDLEYKFIQIGAFFWGPAFKEAHI